MIQQQLSGQNGRAIRKMLQFLFPSRPLFDSHESKSRGTVGMGHGLSLAWPNPSFAIFNDWGEGDSENAQCLLAKAISGILLPLCAFTFWDITYLPYNSPFKEYHLVYSQKCAAFLSNLNIFITPRRNSSPISSCSQLPAPAPPGSLHSPPDHSGYLLGVHHVVLALWGCLVSLSTVSPRFVCVWRLRSSLWLSRCMAGMATFGFLTISGWTYVVFPFFVYCGHCRYDRAYTSRKYISHFSWEFTWE